VVQLKLYFYYAPMRHLLSRINASICVKPVAQIMQSGDGVRLPRQLGMLPCCGSSTRAQAGLLGALHVEPQVVADVDGILGATPMAAQAAWKMPDRAWPAKRLAARSPEMVVHADHFRSALPLVTTPSGSMPCSSGSTGARRHTA
jgi:hypothetical protein